MRHLPSRSHAGIAGENGRQFRPTHQIRYNVHMPNERPRRFRFSLRTLFVVMTAAAVLAFAIGVQGGALRLSILAVALALHFVLVAIVDR